MQTGDFLTNTMRSLGFLSRIPVHDIFFDNEATEVSRTTPAFPVAGALIALPFAIAIGLLAYFDADPLLSAAIALAISTIVTGALHEDGLADTADGFGGGRTKERTLEIMKDSRLGTYGAIALVLSFLLRVAAIAALVRELSPLGVAACLIAVAALSRGLMVWHWQTLPTARHGGVAAAAGQPGEQERTRAVIFGSGIAVLLALPFFSPVMLAIAIATPFAATHLFNRLCVRKIDGHTGDTIGATQQITEIVMLLALAVLM